MVASLAAVGQRMGTEQHPTIPYQHRPLSGIFHDVLALPCPRPLHTPSWVQGAASTHPKSQVSIPSQAHWLQAGPEVPLPDSQWMWSQGAKPCVYFY